MHTIGGDLCAPVSTSRICALQLQKAVIYDVYILSSQSQETKLVGFLSSCPSTRRLLYLNCLTFFVIFKDLLRDRKWTRLSTLPLAQKIVSLPKIRDRILSRMQKEPCLARKRKRRVEKHICPLELLRPRYIGFWCISSCQLTIF